MKISKENNNSKQKDIKKLIEYCNNNSDESIEQRISNWNKVLKTAKVLKDPANQALAAEKLAFIYFETKNTEKTMGFLNQAITHYKVVNNLERIVSLEINIGVIYLQMHEFSKTIAQYEKLLNTYKLENENFQILYQHLGLAYYFLGNYPEALKYYKKTLELLDEEKDTENLSGLYNKTGMLYKILEDYSKALKYLLLSSEIRERLNDEAGYAGSLNNIGGVYFDWDNKEKALEYYNKALNIYKEIGKDTSIAGTLTNIGTIHSNDGNYEKALKYFEDALQVSKKIKDDFITASTLNNIGALYKKKGNNEKSFLFTKKALEYKRKVGNKEGIFVGLQNLSIDYLALGNIEEALEYAQQCLEIAKETESDSYKYKTYSIFTDIFKKQKKYKKALDYHIKYSKLKAVVFKKENMDKIAEMQVRYETQQKEKEAEILRIKNDELAQKNKMIEEKNQELQDAIEKFNHSEIRYNFVTEEMEKSIGTTLVGCSKAIVEIRKLITLAAGFDNINVLITGESGTGKEVVAKNIHKLSKRKNNKFYAVNSSAIPETLFESQFFGHEKNAFTGADTLNIGWFEVADKSTLFLDEIGTLSGDLQVKLLRVLEDRKIVRVGSHQEIEVDVRIISATNINLLEKVKEEKFRVDLYHRLATYVIDIPPLRERIEDIPLLLRYFVKHFSNIMNKKITRIDEKLENALTDYDFPGNVRELKNMVERAILISNSSILRTKCFIIPNVQEEHPENESLLTLEEIEKQQIIKALNITGFHRQKAADLLKVNRKVIERRIKKYNITR
ncbi:MAG: hypothetical protein B1H05_05535 [Candidatus Cloacimonas sp. 4484_140]|nr:MAG: hypothetical protein B1H05_05535 [Candidatus Cloacimonas sp. 4484_140]